MAQSKVGAARRQMVGDMIDYKMLRAVSNFDDKKYVMQGVGLLGQAVHAMTTNDDSYFKASMEEIMAGQSKVTGKNDSETEEEDPNEKKDGEGDPKEKDDDETIDEKVNKTIKNVAQSEGMYRLKTPFRRISHAPFFKDYKANDLYGSTPLPRIEPTSPIQRRRFINRNVFGATGFDPRRSAFGDEVASVPADPNQQTYELGEETRIDENQRMAQLSFLGEAGAAFSEGYNFSVDRLNYKQRVWAQQAKDFDEIQGKFNVPPSGLNDFDTAIKDQSSAVIDQYFTLYKNRNNMDPAKYAKLTNELTDWSKQMKLGVEGIKGMIKNYVEDKDNLSLGSDAEIIDLYETLAKGGEGLKLVTKDGITYLQGTTLGNRDLTKDFNGKVQGTGNGIAIKDLAGPNAFRYLKKFKTETWYNANLNGGDDGTGEKVDGLLMDEAVFYKTADGKFIKKQGVNASKIRESIEFRVENLLQSDSRVRAIAGDRLGLDSDIYNSATLSNKPGGKAVIDDNFIRRLKALTGGEPKFDSQGKQISGSRLAGLTFNKEGTLVDGNGNPISGEQLARLAVGEFIEDGLISRINDQSVVKELKMMNYTSTESRSNYRASKINKYKMDFSKLLRTSELESALGGKEQMYTIDVPGLRNAFINIKDVSGSEIKTDDDGKKRLVLTGPKTRTVVKEGEDPQKITTTTKTVGDIDISVFYETPPKKSDTQKYRSYIARRKTAIENLTNVAVGLEMSAYDQFDLNPNIKGDEGMGVSEKFGDAAVN